VSRRGSIEGLVNYRYSDSDDSAAAAAHYLRSYSVGGRYRHGVSRYASLRLGYAFREGQYGLTPTTPTTRVHDIDVGVDYARALSVTRRTSIDFSTGSSVVTVPAIDPAGDGREVNEVQLRLVGTVGLLHEMGRSWRLRVAYNRGVGFAEAFAEPVFADGFNASLHGFFNRRTDFSTNGGFSFGDVGLRPDSGISRSGDSFRTWFFSARSQYALGSLWAVYTEYLYYSQDLGATVIVPDGIPATLHRHTMQIGLTFWVPFLGR
jgi:hypothetical protein